VEKPFNPESRRIQVQIFYPCGKAVMHEMLSHFLRVRIREFDVILDDNDVHG
jgi:hypothetical protein